MLTDHAKYEVYWRQTEALKPRPRLRGQLTADVCIVGGGYTGMWTAMFLKMAVPSLDIVVLEADSAGAGASGHNDGFAGTQLERGLRELISRLGVEAAALLHQEFAKSVAEIGTFCEQNGIDAEYEANGYLSIATNEGQWRRLERELAAVAQLGVEDHFALYEGPDAREVLGSPAVIAALKDSRRALLNPHKLAQGLARTLVARGVQLFERSPVAEVTVGHVRTTEGVVRAQKVVVATNAYQHRFRPFRRTVVPMWSYSMMSEPLSKNQWARVSWPNREGFEDERNYTTICRPTKDNRVLWAGRLAPYFWRSDMRSRRIVNPRVFRELGSAWRDFFPMWRDVRCTHAYGGAVGVTRSLMPYVGQLDSDIYYAYGYSGHGVSPSHTVGQILRDLVLERDTQYTRLELAKRTPQRVPPEPIRFLGVRLTTALLRRQDRKMDDGHATAGAKDPFLLRLAR